jgi:hypothetical protein
MNTYNINHTQSKYKRAFQIENIRMYRRPINFFMNLCKNSEKIDEEYLIHLLKNDLIQINDVKLFGDFVIQYICDIGSVECETESKEKWNKLKENIIHINIFISNMFIFMIELIEVIKNELLDYEFLLTNIFYSL